MTTDLHAPRIIAAILGGLEALLGGFILLVALGTPAHDPAGAPGRSDLALGLVLTVVPLALMVLALKTRKATIAWAGAAGLVAIAVVSYWTLFV